MGAMGGRRRSLHLGRPSASVLQVHRPRISQGHTRLQQVEPSNEKYYKEISTLFFEYFKYLLLTDQHVHRCKFDSYLMAV